MSSELYHTDAEYTLLCKRQGVTLQDKQDYCEKLIDRITGVLTHAGPSLSLDQKERFGTQLRAAKQELAVLKSGQGNLFDGPDLA